MNLLWLTLLNGMLEWFPTGTMKTFFGDGEEGACHGGEEGASPESGPRVGVLTTSTEMPAEGSLKACRDRR